MALLCLGGLALTLTGCAPSASDVKLDKLLTTIHYKSAGHVTSYTKVSNIDSVSRRVIYSSEAAYPVLMQRFRDADYQCADDNSIAGERLASCENPNSQITVYFKATDASKRTSLTVSLP